MGSMDELRSPSLPTRPAAPVIVFPSPSMLSVLQLLGTIRCPKKPRAAQMARGGSMRHRMRTPRARERADHELRAGRPTAVERYPPFARLRFKERITVEQSCDTAQLCGHITSVLVP